MSTELATQTRSPNTNRPWLGGLPEFYALRTIWHERNRFLPAILAVAFSATLIAAQAGLLLGLLSMMSTPVDRASADVWIGYSGVKSVDLGLAMHAEEWELRLKSQPEVDSVESVVMSFSQWAIPSTPERPGAVYALVTVIGTSLDPNSIALLEPLRGRPEVLAALHEQYTIAIDESECSRLGVRGVDDVAVIMGQSVRVVGLVKGLKSLAGAYVFCSADTARHLLGYRSDLATYVLAKVRDPKDAEQVAAYAGLFGRVGVYQG